MPRLHALLECVGQALCEKGRKALQGQWPFADVLGDIARVAFEHAHRKLPGPDLRTALADCAAVDPAELERRLGELVSELAATHTAPKAELAGYLRALPVTVRQMFRRPSDPTGRSAPEKLTLARDDEFAAFLPPRVPRFRPGDQPAGLDNWHLTELRGLGPITEVWRGEDPDQPDNIAALKFVTDADVADRVKGAAALFTRTFEVNEVPGVLPLRSVYLESDPPCLETPFVYGYDLAGLMLDWKWRYDGPKPEAALKLVRRLTSIIAGVHEKHIVHRDLKPSNVLLHPTEGGKFSMWVSDYGWGQLESERPKGGHRGEEQRLARRGAATGLYASPQQSKKEPPAPTDDVHAIGVIWYQLLRRDVTVPPPVGTDWIEELRPAGFTDTQARLLLACLSTRADKRPRNAAALAEALAGVTVAPSDPASPDGSKLLSVKSSSSAVLPAAPGKTSGSGGTATGKGSGSTPAAAPASGRHKTADPAAAAASAAAMLASIGGAPISGGPGSSSAGPVRVLRNSLGMTFVRIPAGTFRMGDDTSGRSFEGPTHEVRISRAFYLATTPVTQAQYEAVMGKHPSKFNRSHGGGADHPVENVSYADALKFCEKLAKMPDELANRRIYRLPTEAEWEYACRAGTTTDFSCGDTLAGKDALFSTSGNKQAGKTTGPVGQFPSNPLGLHDMHGNVLEWVSDWFDEYYYFESPVADPQGPKAGTLRVVRGGCFSMLPIDCRSAARRGHAPEAPSETIGFRVVLEAM